MLAFSGVLADQIVVSRCFVRLSKDGDGDHDHAISKTQEIPTSSYHEMESKIIFASVNNGQV